MTDYFSYLLLKKDFFFFMTIFPLFLCFLKSCLEATSERHSEFFVTAFVND